MTANNFTYDDAYAYYERRLIDIMRAGGKTTLAWQDIAGFPRPWKQR
jgi:hypothetical protein